ncbi:PfkB family carbohydrate kinase [Sphingobacterium sp. HJSM2_6]|uniref:PfkB family carbohydrate kinase n=1 Tax=Sphingobacterium sp. HJSM2_6 TaxID=3366264 RepID=UPI003BE9B20B
MKKVLTFGEILIRQQSVSNSFFEFPTNLLKIYPGGSEANVAVGLALMGDQVAYVSAFPNNPLSEALLSKLDTYGVGLEKVIRIGDRVGSYILLSSNGLSSGEVIYDRKYSAFSQLELKDIPVDHLLDGIDWFHWSALTPALNQQMADLLLVLLEKAKNKGITISVDLNYRSRLWQYGKKPLDVMPTLVAYCDVIMGNIWASHQMLGTQIDENLNKETSKEVYIAFANQVALEVFEKYPQAKHIAQTFRFINEPTHNLFYGTYHNRLENTYAQTYETNEVVDRIGSGDAFMAGLIYAIRQQHNAKEIIEIATGAGYQKLFIEGDFGNGKY